MVQLDYRQDLGSPGPPSCQDPGSPDHPSRHSGNPTDQKKKEVRGKGATNNLELIR